MVRKDLVRKLVDDNGKCCLQEYLSLKKAGNLLANSLFTPCRSFHYVQ